MVLENLSKDLFELYAFYGSILALKLATCSFLTIKARLTHNIFANPEDAAARKGTLSLNDERVERTRRIHLNDMENIIPFLFLSFLYICTNPALSTATYHFRAFTVSRFVHTVCYLFGLPRLSFVVGLLVNISMGVQCIMHFM